MGVTKPEAQKMLWIAEQIKNPDQQPKLVRLPSGISISRQQSQTEIERQVSSKWEERALFFIAEVKNSPAWLPGCACFDFLRAKPTPRPKAQ